MTLPCPLSNACPSLTALKVGLSLPPPAPLRAPWRPRGFKTAPLFGLLVVNGIYLAPFEGGGSAAADRCSPPPSLFGIIFAIVVSTAGGIQAPIRWGVGRSRACSCNPPPRPAATSSSSLGRLAVELRVVNWARPRSGALPGRAVWFTMSLIRPRPPHANVFPFSKAHR
jgi:hypothetical protein